MSQVRHLLWPHRVGGLQIKQKPEAVEVSLDIIVGRVPFLKRQLGGELRLSRRLEPDRDGCDPDLRAFRVQIAAETLEVGTEVQHESPEVSSRKVGFGGTTAKTVAQCASTSFKRGMRSIRQRVKAAEATERPQKWEPCTNAIVGTRLRPGHSRTLCSLRKTIFLSYLERLIMRLRL